MSLVAWAAAFFLAIYFSARVAQMIPPAWGGEGVRLVLAFAGIFIVSLVAAGILQWGVARLVSGTGLSGTDRFLGFVFGGARGVLICVLVLMALREVSVSASWWEASILKDDLLALEDEVRDLLGRARDLTREVPAVGPDGLDMPDVSLPVSGKHLY